MVSAVPNPEGFDCTLGLWVPRQTYEQGEHRGLAGDAGGTEDSYVSTWVWKCQPFQEFIKFSRKGRLQPLELILGKLE